ERGHQIGRGINQRSIEVEDDCGCGHGMAWLAAVAWAGKAIGLAARAWLDRHHRRDAGRHAGFSMDIEAQKRAAAARAVDFVRPGMRLGLGTGSTARHFVELLAERVRGGLTVVAVPTSEATRHDAERLRVPLTTLDETPVLDLTVDGADEI